MGKIPWWGWLLIAVVAIPVITGAGSLFTPSKSFSNIG